MAHETIKTSASPRQDDELGEAAHRPLTNSRRLVLDALTHAGRPLGAYDLIDLLALDTGKRLAPISVYRALDWLVGNGLAHRLASRNAYLACGHSHERRDIVAFLICSSCGKAVETTSEVIRKDLLQLAEMAGFKPDSHVIEVAGECRECRKSAN